MEFNDDENIEWLMESSKTVEEVGENDDDFEQRERESLELCRFLHALRESFENEPILIESKAKGTVTCEEDIQKLLVRLKALGYFFSKRNSGRKFENRLMIINKKIPPSSHPYRVLSHTYYCCSLKLREAEEKEPEKVMKSSSLVPKCKAMMEVRQIEIFTTVSLPGIRRKKMEMLGALRKKLMKNPLIEGKIKYEIVISLPKTHNHPPDFAGKRVNEEVKAAMYYVLHTGTTSLEGIQRKLYRIVDREFENDSIKPSRDNTAFYPTTKTIYYHLRRDGVEVKRVHKANANRLIQLKNRAREHLISLAEKVESCSDLETIFRMYTKIKNVDDGFEYQGMVAEDSMDQES